MMVTGGRAELVVAVLQVVVLVGLARRDLRRAGVPHEETLPEQAHAAQQRVPALPCPPAHKPQRFDSAGTFPKQWRSPRDAEG